MGNNNQYVFFELIRAGLWEKEARLSSYGVIGFPSILVMAEEQGVIGLVAAGLEHVVDIKLPKKDVIQFIGRVTQLEQRNTAMNYFIGVIVDKMHDAGINTLLVKGQGVAQCYERPMWRPSGDVDFLLDKENYQKAKDFLLPLSSGSKHEERYSQHFGISIDPWYVEIHGTLRTGLSGRVDKMVDAVQNEVFLKKRVRTWKNGETQVFLPAPNHDVFLVFTHFIKHFYKEGVCLRQVCDWVRLLWSYRSVIDVSGLELWIKRAGLMNEWKAFASLAVEYLGMPVESMPLYSDNRKWIVKANRIKMFIFNSGGRHKVYYTFAIAKIFPWSTLRFSPSIFLNVNWLKIKERILVTNG